MSQFWFDTFVNCIGEMANKYAENSQVFNLIERENDETLTV